MYVVLLVISVVVRVGVVGVVWGVVAVVGVGVVGVVWGVVAVVGKGVVGGGGG